MDAVRRDIDPRNRLDDLVDLGDHDAVLERRCLHHGGRVLGVRAGVEVAVTVGADGGDQGDVRGEIDEVAREQFEIGVNCSQLDLAAEQHARDARRLRPGIGIVEPLRDPAVEQVQMFGQNDARLHHVQIVDLGQIDRQQRAAQEIRLLLVVAFEANPVARPDHGLQQARCVGCFHDLAVGQAGTGRNAGIARGAVVLPARHDLGPFAALAPLQSDPGLARSG
ncbi:hypothetical protein ACVWZR_010232 [Bradyrhizobium sp. i1.3.1]